MRKSLVRLRRSGAEVGGDPHNYEIWQLYNPIFLWYICLWYDYALLYTTSSISGMERQGARSTSSRSAFSECIFFKPIFA